MQEHDLNRQHELKGVPALFVGAYLIDRPDVLATSVVCKKPPRSAPSRRYMILAPRCRPTHDQDGRSHTKKLVSHVYGVLSSPVSIEEMEMPL